MIDKVRPFLMLALAATLLSTHARADDFYRGKQVTIVVGFSSAGTYDATARLFARHFLLHLSCFPQLPPQ